MSSHEPASDNPLAFIPPDRHTAVSGASIGDYLIQRLLLP